MIHALLLATPLFAATSAHGGLLGAAPPLAGGVARAPLDDAVWRQRLGLPSLYQANFQLVVRDEDIAVLGWDLGFPHDVRERLSDAQTRLEGGERSAAVLHQAVSGLVAQRNMEPFQRLMPACLGAYQQELEAAPEDAGLYVGFAKALQIAGQVTRDDRFFGDASTALERAAELAPDDWRVPCEHSSLLALRAMNAAREGGLDAAWLARAEDLAQRAAELDPTQVAPHWRGFFARYVTMLLPGTGSSPDRLGADLTAAADEVARRVGSLEGAERLRLAAEGYWFMACLPAAADPGDELESPAEAATIQARLLAFPARLEAVADVPPTLRRSLVRTWWTLYTLAGPLGSDGAPAEAGAAKTGGAAQDAGAQQGALPGGAAGWEPALATAVAAGTPEEEALTLALVGLHRRGAPGPAADAAARLVAVASGDDAYRALAKYRHETGDDAGALEAIAQIVRPDSAVVAARAILELRTGQGDAARETLASLAAQATGQPWEGPVRHALGVALALAGEHEAALEPLAAAVALEQEGAAETLAEVRARR